LRRTDLLQVRPYAPAGCDRNFLDRSALRWDTVTLVVRIAAIHELRDCTWLRLPNADGCLRRHARSLQLELELDELRSGAWLSVAQHGGDLLGHGVRMRHACHVHELRSAVRLHLERGNRIELSRHANRV